MRDQATAPQSHRLQGGRAARRAALPSLAAPPAAACAQRTRSHLHQLPLPLLLLRCCWPRAQAAGESRGGMARSEAAPCTACKVLNRSAAAPALPPQPALTWPAAGAIRAPSSGSSSTSRGCARRMALLSPAPGGGRRRQAAAGGARPPLKCARRWGACGTRRCPQQRIKGPLRPARIGGAGGGRGERGGEGQACAVGGRLARQSQGGAGCEGTPMGVQQRAAVPRKSCCAAGDDRLATAPRN